MEGEEGVGLVLARATELRLKISDCIESANTTAAAGADSSLGESRNGGRDGEGLRNGEKISDSGSSWEVEEDEEEEAERLLHIRDALESLESQLASLQNLRQRQQYEKQVALSEIDYSRKMLLEKLKDYKGKDLEVIHETSAFAGERVEYKNDLLLPPYAIRPPLSLLSDNGYISNLTSKQKSVQNGLVSSNSTDETKADKNKNLYKESQNPSSGIARFASSIAKIVLPIIGVAAVLLVSGHGSGIRRRCMSLKLTGVLLPPRANEERRSLSVECPPGKVLVVEDGEARCLVKERVEIPFESIIAKRDANYGYG